MEMVLHFVRHREDLGVTTIFEGLRTRKTLKPSNTLDCRNVDKPIENDNDNLVDHSKKGHLELLTINLYAVRPIHKERLYYNIIILHHTTI